MKYLFVIITCLLPLAAHATQIYDLKQNSNAYFVKPQVLNQYHLVSLFTVRETTPARKNAKDERPVYFENQFCKVTAYNHFFAFGQKPANHLTAGEQYILLHVRDQDVDVMPDSKQPMHILISIGSLYANPRVLTLECTIKANATIADLVFALGNQFQIKN
jgi:hypothetical protein